MRRPLFGRESIASLTIKPLAVMTAASAAFFAAPAAASAAPTGTVKPAVQEQAATSLSGTTSSERAGAAAVFNCRYFSRAPFQVVHFTCLVQSGHLRVVVNCADGRRVSGPLLGPRPHWQAFSVSCAPAKFTTFDWYTRG